MRIQSGQLIALGYGRWVRSDAVIAVEPIEEGRGPGRRTQVWVQGLTEPLIASRADASIVDDLVTPAEDAARLRKMRDALEQTVKGLEAVPGVMRRVLKEESGLDLDELLAQTERAMR